MLRLAVIVVALLAVPAGAARDLPARLGMYPQQGTALPMLDSDVVVRVRGAIVEATVTQTFKNDSDRVTEATYIFPLPTDAAVSAMEIETGNRTIRAAIESREQAVQRYEAAVSAGVGAGLLEQERPDVFTQTVSAIPARGTVKVTLRFDSVARYRAGTWELVLPLVVAPRFVPGTASGRPTTGTGRAPDTDRAPDASRVTPGGAPGAGGATQFTLELLDQASGAVEGVTSPTHELTATKTGYTFTDPKSDHDAIVRWHSKAPSQAWVEPAEAGGGFAAVLVQAKSAPASRKAAVRVAVVLDHAATTRGDAEAVQRPIVRSLLAALDARDSVALVHDGKIAFGTAQAAQRAFDERAVSSTPFDLSRVLTGLRGDHAIVLVTDGLVTDDKAVLAAAAKLKQPVHVIGVGPAPNRGLLGQIATTTGGTIRFATVGDDLAALSRDVLADAAAPPDRVAITWGTLAVSEVVPATLPRLGAGQSLLVLGRVKKVQAANARVRGDLIGFTQAAPPKVPDGATSTKGPLARRWAKLVLDDLVAAGDTKKIAEHALRYGLVSPVTAMVAIGDEVVVQGGVKHTVAVPVSVPAGMQWQLVKQQTSVDITGSTTTTAGEDQLAAKQRTDNAKTPVPDKKREEKPKTTEKAKPKPDANKDKRPVVVGQPKNRPIAVGRKSDRTVVTAKENRVPIAAGPAPRATSPTSGAAAGAPGGAAPMPPPPPEPDVDSAKTESADAEEELRAAGAPESSPAPVAAADYDAYDEDDVAEEISLSPGSRRRALRLALSLGGGISASAGATSGFGALAARAEFGRRTLVGVEGSLWLVDGDRGQGSVLGTITRRGIARRLELSGGAGLRITGDAVGPAIELTLRALLPVRHLGLYLRYDGALLRDGDAMAGQNAGSLGLEVTF
jgi:Ca-activated chloride channel family protein